MPEKILNNYQWQIRLNTKEPVIYQYEFFRSRDDKTAKSKAVTESKLRKQLNLKKGWKFIYESEREIVYELPFKEVSTVIRLIRSK